MFKFCNDLWHQKTKSLWAIVCNLHNPTFSHFDTILECDRQTHRHTTTAYTALAQHRAVIVTNKNAYEINSTDI